MRRWVVSLALVAASCGTLRSGASGVVKVPFGTTGSGVAVDAWELVNAHGLRAKLSCRGATLVSLLVPDGAGGAVDVVLGFDDVSGYESDANDYFGSTIGRVANRIARGQFLLDGTKYSLAINNGPNHLHGGLQRSFDKVVWSSEDVSSAQGAPAVAFRYESPHLEEGYPGRLDVRVVYTLTEEDELRIDYEARADRRTPVNLTNHTYWNLAGAGRGTILDHEIEIAATQYTPTDETLIPIGVLAPVAATPLDLRQATRIGDRIATLRTTAALGYDHNFVLDGPSGVLRFAARLRDPKSGRSLEIDTTEPGLQFYSGNFLHGQKGKSGLVYEKNGALCLEAQHYPDSVNQPTFPSIILEPGAVYRQTTIHRLRW